MSHDKYSSAFWDEVKAELGAEQAKKVAEAFSRSKPKDLTAGQQRLFDYLKTGEPIISLRQLARDCGFDHPQKAATALSALVVKGKLTPKED